MFRSILNCQLNQDARQELHRAVADSPWSVRHLNRYKTLKTVHNGCVNTIQWNNSGDLLLSGSDDKKLAVTRWIDEQVVYQIKGLHKTNIMSAKFLPQSSDTKAISCSGDGIIMVSDLEREDGSSQDMFNCHLGPVYDIVTIDTEPNTFLSVGEDGTARWFDLRAKKSCRAPRCKEDILFSCQSSLSSATINPILPHELAIGTYDGHVYVMDRRMLGIDSIVPPVSAILSSMRVPGVREQTYRTTSVQFSPEGDQILASFSGEGVYLFDVKNSPTTLSVPKQEIEELFNNQGDSASRRRIKQRHSYKRVRLRGDWSDTGPTAGINNGAAADIGQARPTIHESFMQRMTELLRSMTNLNSNGLANNAQQPMSPVVANEPSFPVSSPSTGAPEEIESVSYEALARSASNQQEDVAEHENNDDVPAYRVRQDSEQSSSGISISRDIIECIEASKVIEDNDEEMEDVSHQCDYMYLQGVKVKYQGHRNARTAINEATFWGRRHIMSGSDCGHVFVWDRFSGKVVGVLQADAHVVNRVRPHPYEPILATSGIDHDIKLWAPSSVEGNEVDIEELMARNARMLEETRDTITVPASYMIRMLATMSHFWQSRQGNGRSSGESSSNLS